MALIYKLNGVVEEVVINAIMDYKVTSSLAVAPTIQQAFEASASKAIYMNAINACSSSAQAYNLAYPSGSANRNGRR